MTTECRRSCLTRAFAWTLVTLIAGTATARTAHAVVNPQSIVTASDGAGDDRFGASVALSGDLLLVGAVRDDDKGTDSGSAYLYTKTGATWTLTQKLTASDGAAGDRFGVSVAIQGYTLVVGAYNDDDFGGDSGAAYVFQWNGASWIQVAKIRASDGAGGDLFGGSVALDGDYIVVGAPKEDAKGTSSGSAYVFVRSSGYIWSQQAKIFASDGASNDLLGYSVSISGDTALLGAAYKNGAGSYSGAAYVFTRSGTTWSQQAKLTASDAAANDSFGNSVSVYGNTAVIGAFGDDTGVSNGGSAYVFTRSGSSWSQQAKLTASDGAASDNYGTWVSIDGNILAVGSPQADAVGSDAGAAYLYEGSGASWPLLDKVVASNPTASAAFGAALAVDAGRIAFGALLADTPTVDAGSAYVYDNNLTLTVAKNGTGAGTVASSPAGISCGATCSAGFTPGAVVTLTATPSAGSSFTGWSGAGCSGSGTCQVTMSAAQAVTATFTFVTPSISVTKAGNGAGTVTSSPAGVDCGATCSSTFTLNELVTLTASPSVGSAFTGWSGAGCSGTGTCQITANSAASVTANFTLQSFTLSVAPTGTGTGSITSSPFGISCGTLCSSSFPGGEVVTLTAATAPGSSFDGWSGGGCSGTGTCQVTMDAAKSVTASFTLQGAQLTVNKVGTGSGTVTSSPTGIDCGPTCVAVWDYGTNVAITAVAAPGSTFTSWAGPCTGTGTCNLPMTTNRTLSAIFTLQTFPVTVTKDGNGSGTVSSSPAGISCGATCSGTYNYGTVVALAATPTAGSTFVGWSGEGCSGTSFCAVTVDAAKNVHATFALQTFALSVTKAGAGSGTVTSAPAGIDCGATCAASYDYGTTVTLTPAPAPGSSFAGWSGACTGSGSCQVSMTAAKSVTATFALQSYTLSVSKIGTGSGGVTSSPLGISCGATCAADFTHGTVVTLAAIASGGSTFTGWGGACAGTGTCQVTVTEAQAVTASFTLQTYALNVALAGTGTGGVTSSPAGIDCGATCVATYGFGTNVTLTATPTNGSIFAGWSGACTGTGGCTVPMTAARNVTATFTLPTYSLSVALGGTGAGTVTSDPAGIDCGATCVASFGSGALVTLTAAPAPSSSFAGWSGACDGTDPCVVTMDAAKTVTATFDGVSYPLTVTKTGNGTVVSNPTGINCGTACIANFAPNTVVTLTATPAAGSTFSGWSGGVCTGTAPCQVTMSAARGVTATFAAGCGAVGAPSASSGALIGLSALVPWLRRKARPRARSASV
ncbi:MAG: FG-GAP repeat protein [Deltaproteobacteria bacterium]|nr:FG-GAP repeat protein [Deltaproteobacteria bacterium]